MCGLLVAVVLAVGSVRGPGVPPDTADLNLAVQMTIDRAIFLRVCEDRGALGSWFPSPSAWSQEPRAKNP
jgi:hypothetical protein